MGDASNFNRWFIVTVALVVGFLIGVAFAAYLVYAWVPANIILRDAPPKFLRFDSSGSIPEYRDLYVARAANRFVTAGQSDVALQDAQAALGVTSGDATPIEALNMARGAEEAARRENAAETADPNVGRFTLLDQSNLQALADRLDQVKDQPPVVAQDVLDARRNAALYGLLLLLLWIALLGGVLLLIANWLGLNRAPAYAPTTVQSIDIIQPAPVAASPADLSGYAPPPMEPVVASTPTQPGTADIVLQPPTTLRAASPIDGENLISTYATTYVHGDERYDDGFPINGTNGEMIGECGASVAEKIGLDSPAPVVALAVWVFDKSDFHSKTKMLLTPYAFRTELIRNKAAERGELVQARPGGMFEVLTTQLRVEIAVRDLQFRPVGGDPEGCFGRLELEFRVFKHA
jgi:hypothetical protein